MLIIHGVLSSILYHISTETYFGRSPESLGDAYNWAISVYVTIC